jgi:hypothetical protein
LSDDTIRFDGKRGLASGAVPGLGEAAARVTGQVDVSPLMPSEG